MNILQIIIASVFVSNVVLSGYIGMDDVLALSDNKGKILKIGLISCLMLTISTFLTRLISQTLLEKYNLQYFELLAYIVIIGLVVKVFSVLFDSTYGESPAYSKLNLVNTLFLGIALLASQNNLSLIDTIIYSIGTSLGVILLSIMLEAIKYKYRFVNMPDHFKGRAIHVMALGLIALAFYGFAGLV
ncbi:Rnf-Nqr domain containing protein [uncultured Helcococcus sp.]|uniref:Rnf-Nqr domain containing protein n=1 Tax=uncultured Helcococcus sp. TaxID=1072508 RepID=UPI00288B17CD|nr:Rnf-Nqr domain containing protein [uncultured Helcococcus sp.]